MGGLKKQISLSFAAILGLLVLVAGMGIHGLNQTVTSFQTYEELATDTNIATELQTTMYLVQIEANEYLATRESESLLAFETNFEALDELVDLATAEITREERASLIAEINTKIDRYKDVFHEITQKMAEQDELVATKLEPMESSMRKALGTIINAARGNNDIAEAYNAAQTREQLMLGQLFVAKFLDSGDNEDYEKAVSEIGVKLLADQSRLDDNVESSIGRKQLAEFSKSREVYVGLMAQVHELTVQIDDLIETGLEDIGERISESSEQISESLERTQGELGAAINGSSKNTMTVSLVTSAVALLAGIAMAFTLVKMIWKPLGAEPNLLLEIIQDVAGGNIDNDLNPDKKTTSGVYSGLIDMQGQLREARQRDQEATEAQKKIQQEKEEQDARLREKEESQRELEKEANERERQEGAELQKKVDSLLQTVEAAADGDFSRTVTVAGDDAIGKVGQGLAKLIETLRVSLSQFKQSAVTLDQSSKQLASVNEKLRTSTEQTADQTNMVSESAVEISTNVDSVATSVEQMSASIKEIAQNSTEAAAVADEAVELANNTNATVLQLSTSSSDIGAVIKVINTIAEQTNLLALNATIEAARAGEAGKGFAVVANEVKDLAKETAKATDEIGQKITAIQSDSNNAVEAIGGITEIIQRISQFQTTIASAVEEQSATTMEMSRSIANTSQGSSEIAQTVAEVAESARGNLESVDGAQTTAAELSSMATELLGIVAQFKLEAEANDQEYDQAA